MPLQHGGQRGLRYILGLYFLALGGAFSIVAGLGTTPVNALPYVISLIFQSNMKFWVTAVMGLYLLMQSLVRRRFRPADLLQLLTSFLFGFLVDLNLALLGTQVPFAPLGRWMYLFVGIAFVSLGISTYVTARFLPMPTEGLVGALAARYPDRWPFHRAKILCDSVSVLLSLLLSLLFLGTVRGVGVGTVISAVLIGKGVQLFQKLFARLGNERQGPALTMDKEKEVS